MKKLSVAIVVTAVCAVVLAGCSSSEETTTTANETETTTTQEEAATDAAGEAIDESEAGGAAIAPTVLASPMVQPLSEDAQVVLTGSGFELGQELRFLVATDQEGLRAVSDVTYACDPQPVANAEGAFITAWGPLGRLVGRGLITEGVYSVVVADTDNNPLTTVAVAFYDSEKPEEEQPAWANPSLTE